MDFPVEHPMIKSGTDDDALTEAKGWRSLSKEPDSATSDSEYAHGAEERQTRNRWRYL